MKEIVIKIDDDVYKDILTHNRERREGGKSAYYFEGLIQNGKPLPKGHGRLIDADALKEEWKEGFHKKIVNALMDDAPTVIEADKGDKE